MENQHREIKGYRELSQEEINLMNMVKEQGQALELLIASIETEAVDTRWISIGKTHFQQGLMALTRAIAKPTFFVFALLILSGCMTTHKEPGGTLIVPVQVEVRSPLGTNQSGFRLQRCDKPAKEPWFFYTAGDFTKCTLLTKADQDEWIPGSSPGAGGQIATAAAVGTGLALSGGTTVAAGGAASAASKVIVKGRH